MLDSGRCSRCGVLFGTEICTWIHTSGIHIDIHHVGRILSFSNEPSCRAAPLYVFPQLCVKLMDGISQFPALWYGAWFSHTASSASVPGVLSTGRLAALHRSIRSV